MRIKNLYTAWDFFRNDILSRVTVFFAGVIELETSFSNNPIPGAYIGVFLLDLLVFSKVFMSKVLVLRVLVLTV